MAKKQYNASIRPAFYLLTPTRLMNLIMLHLFAIHKSPISEVVSQSVMSPTADLGVVSLIRAQSKSS